MWQEKGNKLKKTFEFKDFDEAFEFMVSAAKIFQDLDHHPFWCNDYNKVSFELFTHEAGNVVTDKDRGLAEMIDSIFENTKKRAG